MKKFNKIFKRNGVIIAMIHVDALPATPKNSKNINEIVEKAILEAEIYKKAGVDALMIENMHDVPYLKEKVGPEIISAMTIIGYEVKKNSNLPTGIQILAGANREALACANSAGLDFIRAEGFVFSHIADEGLINSCAGQLLRYRKSIDADNILVFTDIKKKHCSHSITNDVNIVETAKAAEFFLSDGVIITGVSTGTTADINEIKDVKRYVKIPVLVGSGVNNENVDQYLKFCNGLIVGSYFKENSYWENKIDSDKVKRFMEKVNCLK